MAYGGFPCRFATLVGLGAAGVVGYNSSEKELEEGTTLLTDPLQSPRAPKEDTVVESSFKPPVIRVAST